MKKILAVAALGTIALSSCSIFGTKTAAVSGQLKGFSPNQNLQLALVGYNGGKYVVDGNRAQVIDKDRNPKWNPASLAEVSDEAVQSILTTDHEDKVFS